MSEKKKKKKKDVCTNGKKWMECLNVLMEFHYECLFRSLDWIVVLHFQTNDFLDNVQTDCECKRYFWSFTPNHTSINPFALKPHYVADFICQSA